MPSPTFFIIGIATFISFYYYGRVKDNTYRYFFYYLIFSFTIELLGYLFKHVFYIIDFPIYNTYAFVTFIFYMLFYKNLFKKKRNKSMVNGFLTIHLIFTLFDFFILKKNFLTDFFAYNMILIAVLLVITIVVFLLEIIRESKMVFNIKKSFIFWVSVGTLLFCIGVIPIVISSSFLHFDGLFDHILTGLNVVRYTCFVLAFVWFDKQYIY
jgi:hypothetical protein